MRENNPSGISPRRPVRDKSTTTSDAQSPSVAGTPPASPQPPIIVQTKRRQLFASYPSNAATGPTDRCARRETRPFPPRIQRRRRMAPRRRLRDRRKKRKCRSRLKNARSGRRAGEFVVIGVEDAQIRRRRGRRSVGVNAFPDTSRRARANPGVRCRNSPDKSFARVENSTSRKPATFGVSGPDSAFGQPNARVSSDAIATTTRRETSRADRFRVGHPTSREAVSTDRCLSETPRAIRTWTASIPPTNQSYSTTNPVTFRLCFRSQPTTVV